jgi:hypothetical protein
MSATDVWGLFSGIFWTICYILIIRQALQDRIYAMPLLAMTMNISWEFLFTFIYPSVGGFMQETINFLWFALDLGIIYTYLRFWRADYPSNLSPKLMWPQFILIFAASIPLMVAIVMKTGKIDGAVYTAFADNLIMSVLFITMLLRRGDRRGQSLGIAWTKLLGTATASVSQYLYDPTNPIWNVLYIEILFFDILYVVMLSQAPRYQHSPKPTSH